MITPSDVMIFSISCSSVLLWSILFHEIGHATWFKSQKNKVITIQLRMKTLFKGTLRAGYPDDYIGLHKKELIAVYIWGVTAGMIPILIASMINPYLIITLPLYLYGTKGDIDKAQRTWRYKKRRWKI